MSHVSVFARAVRTAAAALAVLLTPAAAAAQAGAIAGTVVAAGSGAPVAGATVRIEGGALTAVTDARGSFRISPLPAGTHAVTARGLGLAPATRRVALAAGATATVELRLEEEGIALPALEVTTSREARRMGDAPVTLGAVSADALRAARPTHPSEIMGRVPGVWVSATGGEGHTTAIRQPKTTNPVYLFLEDGVPTRSTGFFNHNALYEVNLPQADRIEVLKGPATALYGSDAIGGVINVETRAPAAGAAAEASVERGANGWSRALGSVSFRGENDGVRLDVNGTRTDGWRDGTAYDRIAATARWDRQMGAGSLKTVVAVSRIDQQTAGSSALGEADYHDRPTANYTPISFRDVTAVRVSAAYERAGETTRWSVTPFLRWNSMEILPNWSLSYDPTVYTTGHRSAGVLARYRADLGAVRVTGGLDVDVSPGGREEDRVVATRDGARYTSWTRGDRLYDYDVRFTGVSPYLQVESSLLDRLHVTAGLRFDHLGYDYDTHLPALATGPARRPGDTAVSYSHLSPKLGATYDFGRALNLFASYAHGFRAPSEGQLFRQGQAVNTVGLRPVTADSWETGLRGAVGGFDYQLSAYRMGVENDILTLVNPDGTRETSNAGKTLHRGVELGLGARLPGGLRAEAAWSRARHTYEAWRPRAGLRYDGNEMESAPRDLVNARLQWRPSLLPDAWVAVEWSHVGGYWMDAENTTRYGGHDLVNLQAATPVGRGLELTARLNNVTDRRYADTAAFTTARGAEYAPGLPRSLYLGVAWRWEGGR